jgi:hypothetical protein
MAKTRVTAQDIKDATITDADVAAANKDGLANVPSLRTLGPGSQQAAPGGLFNIVQPFSSMSVIGHSYTAGHSQQDAGTSNVQQEDVVAKLMSLFGIHDDNVMHIGQAGSRIATVSNFFTHWFGGWAGVCQYIWPNNSAAINAAGDIVTTNPIVGVGGGMIIVHGCNDFAAGCNAFDPGTNVNAIRLVSNLRAGRLAYRMVFSRVRAGAVFANISDKTTSTAPQPDPTVTLSAGWTHAGQVQSNSAAGVMQTPTNGRVITFTVPVNYTGGTICINWIGQPSGVTHLNGAVASGVTTIVVDSISEFLGEVTVGAITPTLGPIRAIGAQTFRIIVGEGTANEEVMRVTSCTGTSWTVVRSAAINHSDLESVRVYDKGLEIQWSGTAAAAAAATSTAIGSVAPGNPAIITTALPHLRMTADMVRISGNTQTTPSINGDWEITVLSPTTFSIPVNVTSVGAGAPGTFMVFTQLAGQGASASPVAVPQRFVLTGADAGKTIIATTFKDDAADSSTLFQYDAWWMETPDPQPIVCTNVFDYQYPGLFVVAGVYAGATYSKPITDWNTMVDNVVAEFAQTDGSNWLQVADLYPLWFARNGQHGDNGFSSGINVVGNSLDDATKNWPVNVMAGLRVESQGKWGIVASNTPTRLTLTGAWDGGAPVAGNIYIIGGDGSGGTLGALKAGDQNTTGIGCTTATGAPGTLTDTTKNWSANALAGALVTCNGKTGTVASNTPQTITLTAGWSGGGNPGNGQPYTVGDHLMLFKANDPTFKPSIGLQMDFGFIGGESVVITSVFPDPAVNSGPYWRLGIQRAYGTNPAPHLGLCWIGAADWMHIDFIHLNVKGHSVLAQKIFNKFADMPTPSDYQLAQTQGNWTQGSQSHQMGIYDNTFYGPELGGPLIDGQPVLNRIYAIPIYLPKISTTVEMGYHQMVEGSSGILARLGVWYGDASHTRPGRLLQDYGALNVAGTIGVANAVTKKGLLQVTRPGWYWFGVRFYGPPGSVVPVCACVDPATGLASPQISTDAVVGGASVQGISMYLPFDNSVTGTGMTSATWASTATNCLTDTSKAWTVNQFVGLTVTCNNKTGIIHSNDATHLTLESPGWSGGGNPGNIQPYSIGDALSDWTILPTVEQGELAVVPRNFVKMRAPMFA